MPVLLAMLLVIVVFFRVQIASGFSWQFGDHSDGMIEVNLLQHWTNVLHGVESWNRVLYFHPYGDTLGYNDGYLLYGLAFSLIRAFGADPLLAAELVNVIVRAVGVIGMYALLRGPIGCRAGWSLTGSVIFSIANNSVVQAGHAQMLMVSLAPVAGVLLWRVAEAFVVEQSRTIILWGGTFALFLAAWMMSGYYIAWFFCYFMMVLAIIALIACGPSERRIFTARLRRLWKPIATVSAIQIIALVPFLMVYLPKMRESGGYGWRTPRFYSPNMIDVINVGPNNVLWGRLYTGLRDLVMPPLVDTELQSGITPLLFALGIAAAIAIVRQSRVEGRLQPLGWIAVATLLCWLLTIRFGDFSIWRFVKPVLPGSRGIRVLARYQLFAMVPITILVIWWLDRWRGKTTRIIATLLGAALFVEQLNSAPPTLLHRPTQLAMLADIPPIPTDCQSFYVTFARRGRYAYGSAQERIYRHNVDAMTIAEMRHLPTINGLSSFNPPDWKPIDPSAPGYVDTMRAYARAHGLHGVCRLDRTAAGWTMDIP